MSSYKTGDENDDLEVSYEQSERSESYDINDNRNLTFSE